MIERLLASAEPHLGSRPVLVRVDERRHSRILHVGVETGGTLRRLVIKQVRTEGNDDAARERAVGRVEAEYAALRRIDGGFDPGERFIRVRPVACLPEHAALVMEEAPGEPFNRLIGRLGRGWPRSGSRARLEELCRLAGDWLGRFQAFTTAAEDPTPHLAALRSEVSGSLRSLVARRRVGIPESLAGALESFVDRAAGGAPPAAVAVAGMTGEFCPANILVDGPRLAVLDFGLYGPGLALNDLVLFHHHLESLRYDPLTRRATMRRLQAAFLQGYGRPELQTEPLFDAFRVKFKLSRMDATSGRKWPGLDPARRLFYRRVWRLQQRELAAILTAHG